MKGKCKKALGAHMYYIVLPKENNFDYKPYVWKTNLPANKCKNLYARNTNKLQWHAGCTNTRIMGFMQLFPQENG